MSELLRTTDHKKINSALNASVRGTVISGFEYAAGFRLRIERNTNAVNSMGPQVLTLHLHDKWWIGDHNRWEQEIQGLPHKARRGEPDDPYMAYRLMLMIGAVIEKVSLGTEGSLTLVTSDDEELHVQGGSQVWEESWLVEVPPGALGHEQLFIGCDSKGRAFAAWADELLINEWDASL